MKIHILLLFLLTSCQQAQMIDDPVIVKVPVAVSCNMETIPEPEWNMKNIGKDASSVSMLKAVLADLELSRGYIEELRAELKACS
jgi:hypothetical protein